MPPGAPKESWIEPQILRKMGAIDGFFRPEETLFEVLPETGRGGDRRARCGPLPETCT